MSAKQKHSEALKLIQNGMIDEARTQLRSSHADVKAAHVLVAETI